MRLSLSRSALAFMIGASLSGMVAADELNQNDPSDPFAPVPQTRYKHIMSTYRSSPIMDRPANWRELNDRAEQIGGPLGQLREVDEPIRKRRSR